MSVVATRCRVATVVAPTGMLLGPMPWAAQERPSQQRTRSDQVLRVLTVVKITVSGLSRYKEADVIAASGLRAGTQVTSDDLQAASDRLGATGAFAHAMTRVAPRRKNRCHTRRPTASTSRRNPSSIATPGGRCGAQLSASGPSTSMWN